MNKDLKLLYVEDDIETILIYEKIFKNYFAIVDTALNGQDALDKIEKELYDLIILDIDIPFINGIDLAYKIREQNHASKIIMFTASFNQNDLFNSIKVKVDDYILKPIKRTELISTLQKVIKQIDDKKQFTINKYFTWNIESKELIYQSIKVRLTKNEILLLECLITNRNRVLKSSDILDYLDTDNSEYMSKFNLNALSKLISRLNNKISKIIDSQYTLIKNTYGYGYKINLED